MKSYLNILILNAIAFSLISCETEMQPRPVGYPRIDFPEREYQEFNTSQCNFAFNIPTYSSMVKDAKYTQGGACWYNLVFHPFNATLHLSYHEYQNLNEYDSLYEDTRKMVYKHIIRADDIEELDIESSQENLEGAIFRIKGNTATNFNFFLTDKDSRYLRGALYFNAKTNPDSVAPVFRFMMEDVMNLISTFEWK